MEMNPYTRFLDCLRQHRPAGRYAVFLYGSALWGDCTILRDGTPVSDVDLVVVGQTLADLRIAAARITALFVPFRQPNAPFFKVGLKLRQQSELGEEQLTANEAAALLRGNRLTGAWRPALEPSGDWYRRQAHLVVPTRRQCNATQRQLLLCTSNPVPLERYLAARTLLDLPAVLMVGPRDLGGSYADRISGFAAKLSSLSMRESEKRELMLQLGDALRTKRAPEAYHCGTIDEAEATLISFTARCGIDTDRGDGMSFWESHRPLDVRDWQLRQGAA